jgi:YD repeat-containing protein
VAGQPLGNSVTAASTVAVADAPVTAQTAGPLAGTAGISLGTVTLATLSDAYADDGAGDWTAQVAWGDGTALEQDTVTGSGGSFAVQGRHTYANPGAFTARIVLSCDGVTLAVTSTDITIAAASPPSPIVLTPMRVQVDEALSAGVADTLLDPTPHRDADCYTVVVSWGDGTTSQGTATAIAGQPGHFTVGAGGHYYADEGAYLVTVSVSACGNLLATAYCTARIDDDPLSGPPIALQTAVVDATGNLGMHNSGLDNVVVARVSDSGFPTSAGDFTATISWGDGSAPSTGSVVVEQGGVVYVIGSHAYSMVGSFLARVLLQDDGGSTVVLLDPVTVSPAAEGVPANVSAGTMYDADVREWPKQTTTSFGDGSSTDYVWSSLTWQAFNPWYGWWAGLAANGNKAGIYQFQAEHAFAEEGSFSVGTSSPMILDDTGSTANSVGVADGGLHVIGAVGQLDVVSGQAMPTTTLATFSDDDPQAQASDFLVGIAWGQGNSTPTSGNLVQANPDGTFSVVLQAPWSNIPVGDYTVFVTIADAGGASTTVAIAAVVTAQITPQPAAGLAAVAGLPTGPIELEPFAQIGGLPLDDAVSISWGDGTTSEGTVGMGPDHPNQAGVLGQHTYQSPGTRAVRVTITDQGGGVHVYDTWINVFPGSAQTQQLSSDPVQGLLLPVGQAQLSPNSGELQTTQALDFDQSPGTAVGRNPALVYNSGTVDGRPLVQLRIQGDPAAPVPDSIQVWFTWNMGQWSGVWGTPVTFTTTGHQPGDDYVLEVPTSAVPQQQSGRYPWWADIRMSYGTGANATTAQFLVNGYANVVDNASSALGAGWGICGIDHLVAVCCGVLWVYGNGDSRYFAHNPDGTYSNPPEEFGTLVGNADGSWTYTAKDGTVTHFDANGLQTSVVDTHGLATLYRYNGNGALSEVDSIDGGVRTLSYAAGSVTITEPGNRVWVLSQSNGDLSEITDPTTATRNLTYTSHHLTHDSWAPLDTHFAYSNGVLDQIDQGLGSVWVVNPVALVGVNGNAPHVVDAAGRVTTPLGYPDRWSLTATGEPLTHTRADQRTESWARDAHQQVTQYSDFLGLTTGYTYDNSASGKGDLLQVSYPAGGVAQYGYEQTFHHVTQSIDPDGMITDNSYDLATGDLLSSTVAAGTAVAATTSYHWSDGLLTETIDPVGDTITNSYDSDRRPHIEEHLGPDGSLATDQTLGYDSSGNVQTQTNGDDFITTFGTDGDNQLTQTIDADGNTTSQAYDAAGLLTESIDGRGVTSGNAYDQRALLTSSTEDAGGIDPRTTTFASDLDGRQTQSTSPLGEPTRNFYDVDGRGVAQTTPLGYTSDTLFDDDSRVTETADNDANIARSAFDAMGRMLSRKVYDPDGVTLVSSEGFAYDLAGNVTQKIDGDGFQTNNSLDAQERVTSVTEGANSAQPTTTGTLYDLAGHTTGSVDGLGATTSYLLDGDGQVTETIDPLGIKTSSLYDHAGQLTESIDGNSKPSFTYYDGNGQVTQTVDAQTITTLQAYDGNGDVTQSVDGNSNPSYTYYDSHGEVTEQVDALRIPTFSYFDKDGQVTETVDGNTRPGYTYFDSDGRATEAVDARGIATFALFDGNGNVTESIDGNQHPSYKYYDAEGQVTESVDGRLVPTFEYFDHAGQLTESIDRNSKPSFTYYDAHGQATEQVDALTIKTFSYFDADGHVTESVDGNSNPSFTYYDADGQATEQVDAMGIPTLSFFDKDGRVTKSVDGNTNPSFSLYDNDGRATEQIDALGILTFSYFDNDGNVTKMVDGNGNPSFSLYDKDGRVTETIDAMNIKTYTYYDNDGQVTEAVDGNNFSYTYYDADGAVTEAVDGAQHTTLEYRDGDGQVTRTVDGDGFTATTLYDNDGEVTEQIDALNIKTYSYFDNDGRLTKSVDGDGYPSYTLFDADGQATEHIDNLGILTYTYFDKDGQVTETVDGNNKPAYTYFDKDGQVTEEVDARTVPTYKYYDHDGQVTKTVDGNGFTATTLFDADGRATEHIDAMGISTSSVFDKDGEVTLTIDGRGNTLTTLYDLDGRATEHIDALSIPTFTSYDNDNQVTKTVDGDGYTASTLYDGDGAVTETVDGRQVPTLKFYDGDGQLTRTVDGNSNPSSTLYDGDGRATEHIDAMGIPTFSYFDKDGNETKTVDGDGYTLSTLYDLE